MRHIFGANVVHCWCIGGSAVCGRNKGAAEASQKWAKQPLPIFNLFIIMIITIIDGDGGGGGYGTWCLGF